MARPLYQWTLELVGQMAAVRLSQSEEKVTANPMPSARKIRRMRGLIADMLLELSPVVYATEFGDTEPGSKVSAVEDAYDALQDALEALEEVSNG